MGISTPSVGAAEIEAEADYLAAARTALRDMRADVIATDTPEFVSGTDEVWFNQMYRLARARRREDLVDLRDVPLFFGRLDYEPGTVHDGRPQGDGRGPGLRGPPARPRRRGHRTRGRLAGAHLDAVLPGDAGGPARGTAAPPVRLLRHRAVDRVRGRAAGRRARRRSARHPAGGRDRATTIGPDARHRGHHPARAGRAGPGSVAAEHLCPGRTGYRQDRGRPAPAGLPALHRTEPAHRRGHRGRPQPVVPVLHPARAARAG